MQPSIKLLAIAILLTSLDARAANKLLMLWSGENSPPFFITEKSGILPDLAQVLAKELGASSKLYKIPRKRFEQILLEGKGHLYCKANPDWYDKKDELEWSVPINTEKNIVVTGPLLAATSSLTDFQGKTIGTTLGYRYPTEFENAVSKRLINIDIGKNELSNLKKVELQRIDGAVVSDIVFRYYQKLRPKSKIQASNTVISSHDIYCVISKKVPFGSEKIKQLIHSLQTKGTIAKIFFKYESSQTVDAHLSKKIILSQH